MNRRYVFFLSSICILQSILLVILLSIGTFPYHPFHIESKRIESIEYIYEGSRDISFHSRIVTDRTHIVEICDMFNSFQMEETRHPGDYMLMGGQRCWILFHGKNGKVRCVEFALGANVIYLHKKTLFGISKIIPIYATDQQRGAMNDFYFDIRENHDRKDHYTNSELTELRKEIGAYPDSYY